MCSVAHMVAGSTDLDLRRVQGRVQEPTHNPTWKTIPSWFLLPTEDRVIGTDAERAMAVRAGSQIVEVRASHAVLVSQPTKVTKLIEEAAQATATP